MEIPDTPTIIAIFSVQKLGAFQYNVCPWPLLLQAGVRKIQHPSSLTNHSSFPTTPSSLLIPNIVMSDSSHPWID